MPLVKGASVAAFDVHPTVKIALVALEVSPYRLRYGIADIYIDLVAEEAIAAIPLYLLMKALVAIPYLNPEEAPAAALSKLKLRYQQTHN